MSMSKFVKSLGVFRVLLGVVSGVWLYGGSCVSMITSLKSLEVLSQMIRYNASARRMHQSPISIEYIPSKGSFSVNT